MLKLIPVAGAAYLIGTGAPALAEPIAGRKLLLRNGKFVLVSRDAGIDVTGFNPLYSGSDSSLVMDDGITTTTFLLPRVNWRANSSETLYIYRNPVAQDGPSAVKIARVKGGLLKILGTGLNGLPVPDGAGTINVTLNLDGISRRYCMTFNGTGDGTRFVATDAPAASCPAPPSCDATTGGFCWFLGIGNASCDAACAIAGRAYDAATATYAGSDGTDTACIAVLDALGAPAGALLTHPGCAEGFGCFYTSGLGRVRCAAPPTDSSSSGGMQRACACQ